MIWIDPAAQFKRRFHPTEQGFLFYPKAKGGGKLITQAEHDRMVSEFRRWVGGRFRPGLSLLVLFGAVLALALLSFALRMSEQAMMISTWIILIPFLVGYYWLYSAPKRLVKDRPEVARPRTKVELGRATRFMMTWPIVAFGTGLSGLLAFAGLTASPSAGVIVWTGVWVVVFLSYVRIAVQKIQDQRG